MGPESDHNCKIGEARGGLGAAVGDPRSRLAGTGGDVPRLGAFLAFYTFLIVSRPVEAAERAKGALAAVADVFGALADFVVTLFA